MIKIGFYSTPINVNLQGYLGLYRESFAVDYMENNNRLHKLINSFFEKTRDGQTVNYSEENRKNIVELYLSLKRENWEGSLLCFSDNEQVEISDFKLLGYDVCSDSMYYSPLGDGFLMQYNRYPEFYTDMSFEMYCMYKDNINHAWLFNSYETAMNFSQYCNHINKKKLHCIESGENWRPFAIYLYNTGDGSLC